MTMEKLDIKLIQKLQKRVAETSIGASTLRNQGAPGVVKEARKFLAELDLGEFKDINSEKQFNNRLQKYTEELMKQFPRGAKENWGAARKAINVFLETAFYNRFLVNTYKLDKLKYFLELPLDNNAVENLEKFAGKGNLPRWNGIKNLKSEDNKKFQTYARVFANKKGILRIYLDLYFWRS